MIKELKYNGHTANPSDYECNDGDLATAIGVVPEDGTLKPVLPPSEVLELVEGATVMYIHETTEFTHYIVKTKEDKFGWINKGYSAITEFSEYYYLYRDNDFHINAIGNTLLIFTKSAINYYLWKDGGYTHLGDHVPDIGISFGLVGHPRLFSMSDDSKSTFTIDFAEGIKDSNIYSTFSEKNKTSITSQVMAKVNKFVANETVNKGRFCFPFLLRYALRLYDGSLVCHSVPILMNPSTTNCPVVLWNRLKGKKDTYSSAVLDIMLVAATLDYQLTTVEDDNYDLPDWKDIVKSIDVFISKPLYTYDQNGQCENFTDSNDFESRFCGRLYHKAASTGTGYLGNSSAAQEDTIIGPVSGFDFTKVYAEWKYSYIYGMYFNGSRTYPSNTLHLPEFSDDKERENLRNASTFYKLCSIDAQTLYSNRDNRTDIKVEDEYLQSLVAREVMTDDYLSHDRLRASNSFVYNSRLNLGGVKRKLFNGFSAQSMFAYVNASLNMSFDTDNDNAIVVSNNDLMGDNVVSVYIKENGKDYKVQVNSWSMYGGNVRDLIDATQWAIKTYIDGTEVSSYTGRWKFHWPCYFFYPNPNAYMMSINMNGGSAWNEMFYIELKPHEFLNGSFAVLDYNHIRQDNKADFTIPTIIMDYNESNVVSVPNKIYTSEVNNPFYFPLLGINTVGTGKILGISSAAKALSEGQFGQFPLYAFTSEGVWALEVSTTGTYTAKQPITRDVCINANSITQIDSAVLFATNRGIMLISGSQTQCITDTINSPELFNLADLPRHEGLISVFNDKAHKYEQLTAGDITLLPFLDFLSACRMIYDYTHQRIIVYNPNVRYAYVYSLKSQSWGMMLSDIDDNVNSYPEALAMSTKEKTTVTDGTETTTTVPILVDFTTPSADSVTAMVVTRPFKMDEPNVFKTIDTIIQRGFFKRENIQQVLYGSNDLYNWHIVWSSKDKYLRGFRGTPYKAFRLALVCHLDKPDNLFGCTVQFNPRRLNQPR